MCAHRLPSSTSSVDRRGKSWENSVEPKHGRSASVRPRLPPIRNDVNISGRPRDFAWDGPLVQFLPLEMVLRWTVVCHLPLCP